MSEKEKKLVYLFGFSPWNINQIENLLKVIQIQIGLGAKIKVVLMHNGVIGTSKRGKTPLTLKQLIELPISIFAMVPDLKARGIDTKTLQEKINLLEYENLVDILVETPSIISWL